MDKSHSSSFPMVVHSLKMNKELFHPKEDNEELLGPQVPYLSVIGALIYLANYTQPDILHSLLTYLWDIVLHQLRDIGIESNMYYDDMGLFYLERSKSQLFEYVDMSYISNLHKVRSQIRHVFAYGATTISWKSIMQTMETCGLSSIKGNATKLYEDNLACIAQIKEECFKGDRIKHISPNFFYIH